MPTLFPRHNQINTETVTSDDPVFLPIKKIELELDDDRRDKLILSGPSLWGFIYRSEKESIMYRIIPIDQAPLEKRNQTQKWIDNPQDAVAPIIEAQQGRISAKDRAEEVFFIRFKTTGQTTWADIMENPDLSVRLEHAASIFHQFSQWRDILNDNPQEYFLPMPADIVFSDKKPCLLAMPFWGQPDIQTMFFVPQRILYLSPEYIKGQREKIQGRNIDLYAIGISVFQCLFKDRRAHPPEKLFIKIANSSFFDLMLFEGRFPFWLNKADIFKKILTDVKSTIDPNPWKRIQVDTQALAERMDKYRTQLMAESVVKALQSAGRYQEAFTLLQDILLDNTTYDLLLLSGSIANNNLHSPLEAVDLLERAISRDPKKPEAYESQFKALLATQNKVDNISGKQLAERIVRDFEKLSNENQKVYEEKTARYLIAQKVYHEAISFIHPLLFDGKKYLWWKFGMTLAYAEAFLKLDNVDINKAEKFLDDIKTKLAQVRKNKAIELPEIQKYEIQHAFLEELLLKRKKSNGY